MSISVDLLSTKAILTQLTNLGPPSEIRSQAPEIAARALGFDRVLLTGITFGMLDAQALYVASDSQSERMLSRLREAPVALEYPLIEGEIMRRRRAQLITGSGVRAFGELLAWQDYVSAPIVLDGRVLGFFHADRQTSEPSLGERDVESLSTFALYFGLVFERAVLRHRLRVQLEEMERFSSWATTRTSELGDRTLALTEASEGRGRESLRSSGAGLGVGENPLRNLLTQRELEVLQLMVRGETNPEIATELVIATGTVKYHVQNILRKLHASNRAEATSRYLRLTLKG